MSDRQMTGLLLLTAIPFTKGHEDLIRFAFNHLKFRANNLNANYKLHVVVSARRIEPYWKERYPAVEEFCLTLNGGNDTIKVHNHINDLIPQTPKEDPNFWDDWRRDITSMTDLKRFDFVYASELYGMPLAREFAAGFIPFDLARNTNRISGTRCREDVYGQWDNISDFFKPDLQTRVTLFGQESVGKTTTSQRLGGKSYRLGTHSQGLPSEHVCYVPEWARQYLMVHGIEVTREKMVQIIYGQYAAMMAARASNKALIIQDTDLLTTIGYWRLYIGDQLPHSLLSGFKQTKSDLYILMGDAVPLVPDPLRYGGKERETSMDYWTDLLTEFGCEYRFVNERDYSSRQNAAQFHIEEHMIAKARSLREWVR